jgi:hypothetical protein
VGDRHDQRVPPFHRQLTISAAPAPAVATALAEDRRIGVAVSVTAVDAFAAG